ncbi:Uncharacterised protein [Mycobacteroides abscessus subsp. abscessus]|nr:Uncharacterised protein [Mycobacteroides abscessus subsp. abscessus]
MRVVSVGAINATKSSRRRCTVLPANTAAAVSGEHCGSSTGPPAPHPS